MTIFTISLVLFLIMDPIGNISSFLTMTDGMSIKKRRFIMVREMLIALFAMLVFNYIGEFLFKLLEISESTIRLSSGMILFFLSLQIIFPGLNGIRENIKKEEPFVIPFAIPLIAGPALLATIMLFAHLEPSQPVMLISILCAWISALVVFFYSEFLFKIFGKNGLMAFEKLMGMILVLIAIQRFMDGVEQFVLEI